MARAKTELASIETTSNYSKALNDKIDDIILIEKEEEQIKEEAAAKLKGKRTQKRKLKLEVKTEFNIKTEVLNDHIKLIRKEYTEREDYQKQMATLNGARGLPLFDYSADMVEKSFQNLLKAK